MRLNLFGADSQSLSVSIMNGLSENCYIMETPGGKGPVACVGRMGSENFASGAPARGCREVDGSAYFVLGPELVKVDSAGSKTVLGSVPGQSLVSMTDDGVNVIVANGTSTAYYYNVQTSTFSTIALPASAYSIAYLDTYIVFSSDERRWYISAVGDSDSFDSLDFALKSKSPDDLIGLIEDHSEILLFGAKTVEPWFNSGEIDFAFSQNTAGVIDRGTAARHSIAKTDNTIFFLGDDYIVYRLQGYQPVRISTDSIEVRISDVINAGGAADVSNAHAFVFFEHGHKFYQLTIPNRVTLLYNIATNLWSTLKHFDYPTHHANCYCFAYGKHLFGAIDGGVKRMARSIYDDSGRPLKPIVRSKYYSAEGRRLRWKKIKVLCDFGSTPLLSGQGSSPEIVVRWSDDGGRNWKNERKLSFGEAGNYTDSAITRNCGSSRARLIEIYQTDPAPFYLSDAYAEVE